MKLRHLLTHSENQPSPSRSLNWQSKEGENFGIRVKAVFVGERVHNAWNDSS